MAIVGSEGGDTLTLDGMPEALEAREGEPPGTPARAGTGMLGRLRGVWADYVAENKRGWSELVDEQAKDPTLG